MCIVDAFRLPSIQHSFNAGRNATNNAPITVGAHQRGAYRLARRVFDERAQTDLPGCSRCRHRLGMPRCILQHLSHTYSHSNAQFNRSKNPFPILPTTISLFFFSSLYICCRARYRFCSRRYKIARSVRDAAGESSPKYNFIIHT
jgi:hypothetical protein